MIQIELDFVTGQMSRRWTTVGVDGVVRFNRETVALPVAYDATWLANRDPLAGQQFELWVVIGQSQCRGRGGPSPNGVKTGGLLQVRDSDKKLIPYVSPAENDVDGASFAESFGATLARLYKPWVTPVIYNLAVNSTGFYDDRWTVTGDLTIDATARIAAARAAHPGMKLGGFLWHQGRRDAGHASTYQAELLATIAHFQSLAGDDPTAPFILGTLEQSFVDSNADGAAINAIIQGVESVAAGRLVVDLSDRVAGSDGVHFETPEAIKIGHQYADRYFAWLKARGEIDRSPHREPGSNRVVFL